MNLFELAAKISLDSSAYDTGIANARRSIRGLGNEVNNELLQIEGAVSGVGGSAFTATPLVESYSSTLMGLTKATAVVAVLKKVADAIVSLAKAGVSYNMQIETYTANLEVLLGSEEEAAKKIEELKKMDLNSPFDLTSLLDATQQLLAYGIAAEDTGKVLQQLGDISLGNTEKFNGLAYAYAQMNAAGKANMQDIRQMINAGFNPLNAIAEITGETMTELQNRLSAGKVAFSEIEMAIKYATSAVGTFTEEDKRAAAEFAENQWKISDAATEALNTVEAAYKRVTEFLDKAYKARVKRLGDEEDAIRESNSDKLDELRRAQSEELEAFEDATDARIALINKQYEENLKLIDEEKYRQLKSINEQINALKGLTEAEDEATKVKERAAEIARLQSRVDNSSSNRFRIAAQKELNDYIEKIRLEDLENERAAKIEELEIQKDAIEAEADEKKKALQNQNEEETKLIRAEAVKQTKILKEQHEDALKNYRRVLADELEALKEKNDTALEEYKKSIDTQKQYITDRYELTVSDIESTHSALIEATESVEGRFFEGMSKASETLAGQASTLEAQWYGFLGEAFMPLNDTLRDELLPNASKLIDKLRLYLPEIKDAVGNIAEKGNAIVKGVSFILDAAQKWKDLKKELMPWTDDGSESSKNQSGSFEESTGEEVLDWIGRALLKSFGMASGAYIDLDWIKEMTGQNLIFPDKYAKLKEYDSSDIVSSSSSSDSSTVSPKTVNITINVTEPNASAHDIAVALQEALSEMEAAY